MPDQADELRKIIIRRRLDETVTCPACDGAMEFETLLNGGGPLIGVSPEYSVTPCSVCRAMGHITVREMREYDEPWYDTWIADEGLA